MISILSTTVAFYAAEKKGFWDFTARSPWTGCKTRDLNAVVAVQIILQERLKRLEPAPESPYNSVLDNISWRRR